MIEKSNRNAENKNIMISNQNKPKINSGKEEYLNKEEINQINLKSQSKKENTIKKGAEFDNFENKLINEKNQKIIGGKDLESNKKNSPKKNLNEKNNNQSNDRTSKEIIQKENTRDPESDKVEADKIKLKEKNIQTTEIKDKTHLEEIKVFEPDKINSKKDIFILESKDNEKKFAQKSENKNEAINMEENSNKTEKKKITFNNNIIVKKISFLIKKKKTIRVAKRAEEFYISGKEDYSEENELFYLSKIKPKGLKNIDGSCYMNSTLQCFYHIKEFTDYFLKNKFKIKNKKGIITTGLLDVIEGLSQKYSSAYTPSKFKENLIKVDDSFKGSEGKDSGDLTLLILNQCHEELINDYSDLQDMSIDQRKESLLFLDIFLKDMKEKSIIKDLFSYYIRVKNICFGCGTIFYSISLNNIMIFSLEEVFRMNGSDITMRSDERSVSIENCLSCFSFNGSFDKKEFNCQYCKKKSYLFSVKSFATLPKYLIMQMKRGKNEKFECSVEFEENIDLKESYANVEGAPKEKNTKYTLLGGTILYGRGGYGHTVAFCRHFDGEYYLFNDSNFRKIYFKEIKKQKIYLLFYKKND